MPLLLALLLSLLAADRAIDPTWLRRNVSEAAATGPSDCKYKPLFGAGDRDAGVPRSVTRYGEVSVTNGRCEARDFPNEEQLYFVLEGAGALQYGTKEVPVKTGDFLYVGPGVARGLTGNLKAAVMGFKLPAGTKVEAPETPPIANLADVPKQTLPSHPTTTLYQLMIGDTKSTRDRISAAHVVTSLFVMEFLPGGTNFPHHHEDEEEIYWLLDGKGEMVAGSGTDGVAAKFPAKPGDVYYFRMNCTVGFYNSTETGVKSHILAVRSLFPRKAD
jgi:mannose-6-phosphate isomerase-like protein (cupin superfamily)